MRIAIVTIGTRGDVQPYLAVGRALVARGHHVALATHREFEPMVRAAGLEFRPIRGGMREIAETELGRAWLSSAGSPLKYARYAKQIFVPLCRAWCEDADAAIDGCDGVVFYMMALHALHGAERRGLPAVCVSPWPVVPTTEQPPLNATFLSFLPRALYPRAARAALQLVFGPFQGEVQAHRRSVGLRPYESSNPYAHVLDSPTPTVHLFSEHVLPRPRDWDDRHHVAGFAFHDEAGFVPDTSLARFLEEGPPPIYIGFGSMTGQAPEALVELALRAAGRVGQRVVYARGWGGYVPRASDRVHVVDEVPHDWLFPRVAAVVHHGGIGTLSAGLRAGRPTVTVSFFGDQPFWGLVNERLGTGRALSRAGLREDALVAAIRAVTIEERHRVAAAAVADGISREDGAARAAELIESSLRG